jgi:hypothetical protein
MTMSKNPLDLVKGKGMTVSKEISHLVRDKGYPQDRAVAAALSMERQGKIAKDADVDKSLSKNPLDLVKGRSADTMIAEFPHQVGAIRFSEPGALAPGYQGGLFPVEKG